MVRPPKRTHDVWSATLAVFRRLTFLSRRDPSRHRACRAVCRDAPGAVPYFVTSAAVGASRQQQTLWALLRCMSWPRARAPCRLHHDSRRHCGCRCDARRATHAVAVGAVTTHTAAGAPTLWRRCQRVPGVDGHRRRGRRHDGRRRHARPHDDAVAAGAITPHHLVQRPQHPTRHRSLPSHLCVVATRDAATRDATPRDAGPCAALPRADLIRVAVPRATVTPRRRAPCRFPPRRRPTRPPLARARPYPMRPSPRRC